MPSWQAMRSDERNGVSVLERGFRLLDAFGPERSEIGLAEMARQAKLPKSTAFRLAAQLVELGALERSGDSYRLGLRLFELGSNVARQRRLRDTALPFMEDLYEATHEMVQLGVRDGLEVLYVEKILGRRSPTVPTQVGTRRPLHCTALGKVILAHSSASLVQAVIDAGLARFAPYTITTAQRLLDELVSARQQGVAYDRGEYHVGTTCVAAPLLDGNRRAVGALSVSGLAGRFNAEHAAGAVRTAALSLSRAVDWNPWPT